MTTSVTGMNMAGDALQPAALYRLMAWLSPAFPVGAFSYSSGIEWANEAGDITDEASLQRWLGVMLSEGGGYCDAVLFAQAHRAGLGGDDKALHEVAELAAAFAPSKERHLETTAQGNAFIEAVRPYGIRELARTGRIDKLSGGLCRSDDYEAVKARMAKFMAAGFLEICGRPTD